MSVQKIEKGSFEALADVKIYQPNGLPFFFCQKGKIFNLPKGNYIVEGSFKRLPNFVYKKFFDLPKIPINPVKPFKITYVDNYPNKCSVFPDTGEIIADSVFSKVQNFVFMFILCHEYGHFFYRGRGEVSEKMCDKYARQAMLEAGFNPSQIDLAAQITLNNNSPLSIERKKLSFEQLRKK